jgi:hypothetical protein
LFFVDICGYTGDRNSAGLPHGKGHGTYWDGNSYDGEWVNGKMQGNGAMMYTNGNRYEGEWVNNARKGFGVFTNSKGVVVFKGQWKYGLSLRLLSF